MHPLKQTRRVLIVLCVVAVPQLVAQPESPVAPTSPVTAKLTIPDLKTLPGVPFDMWIDVANPSDSAVGVGLCADMLVRPEGSQTFVIVPPGQETPHYPTLLPASTMYNSGPTPYLMLRPHEKKTLTLPVSPMLEGAGYFDDYRLSPPGRYGIALQLHYCWGDRVPQKGLSPVEYMGPVTTNEVTIERVTPTGSDAAVWRRMQEVTRNQWISGHWRRNQDGSTVMNEILSKYSESNYVPYALLACGSGNTERFVSLIEDALKRFPDSPVIDLLHWEAAGSADFALKLITRADGGEQSHDAALMQRLANIRTNEEAKARQAARPTSRIVIVGREDDVPEEPCPADYDCSKP